MPKPKMKLPYDALLTFGAEAALAASADATNVLDLKTNTVLKRFSLVSDITAHKISATDETLSIVFELSNSSDGSGSVTKYTRVVANETSAVDRHIDEVNNLIDGTFYRYAKVSYVVGGTSPSTDLECYLSDISVVGN